MSSRPGTRSSQLSTFHPLDLPIRGFDPGVFVPLPPTPECPGSGSAVGAASVMQPPELLPPSVKRRRTIESSGGCSGAETETADERRCCI